MLAGKQYNIMHEAQQPGLLLGGDEVNCSIERGNSTRRQNVDVDVPRLGCADNQLSAHTVRGLAGQRGPRADRRGTRDVVLIAAESVHSVDGVGLLRDRVQTVDHEVVGAGLEVEGSSAPIGVCGLQKQDPAAAR